MRLSFAARPDIGLPEIEHARIATDRGLAGTAWDDFQENIAREAVVDGKLRSDFLRTPMLARTVHPPAFAMARQIVKRLKSTAYGRTLLARVQDSPIGNPLPIDEYPLLSPVGAQHLYYVLAMKEFLKLDILEGAPLVVDFGGGYGNFSRTLVLLSALAEVDIIDLPIMLAIQSVFHANTLNPQQAARISYRNSPELCAGALDGFNMRIGSHPFHFNATFSLSECNAGVKRFVAQNIMSRSQSFLAIYTADFAGDDNRPFFTAELPALCPEHEIAAHVWPEYEKGHIITGIRRG